MSFPHTLENLKLYVDSLPTFPVNREKQVRYGLTDTTEKVAVVFSGLRITAPEWTTCGPATFASDYTVSCFAKSNADALTLANSVNVLLAGQPVTPNCLLNEFVSLQIGQEDAYRFHALLTYRLQESPDTSGIDPNPGGYSVISGDVRVCGQLLDCQGQPLQFGLSEEEVAGQVEDGIADHVAEADPHVQYLKESDAASIYETQSHAASTYATSSALTSHTGNTSNPHSVTKSQVGLGNVENTALSTWTGSTNVATVGTISSGVWNGTALTSSYLPATVAYTGSANTFTTGQTVQGTIIARSGSTSGTNEIQVSHNGTYGVVGTTNGTMIFASFTGQIWFGSVGAAGMRSSQEMTLSSNGVINWTSAANNFYSGTQDTGLKRAAARVIGLTDGSSGGGTLRSIPLTPAQITADTNNYAPGVARYYRLSTDASRTITGLSVSQVDGQECEIWNVGSNNIVLAHQTTSTAANQFLCTGAADITLAADEIALLRYDATTQRWRVRKV